MDATGADHGVSELPVRSRVIADAPAPHPPTQRALFVYRSSHPGIANPIFEEPPAQEATDNSSNTIPSPNDVVHFGVACDGIHCGKEPATNTVADFIHGPRFHCMVCDNYDLCERCATSSHSAHDKSHGMIKFTRPQRNINVVHGSDSSAVRELLEALQNRDICSPMEFLDYYATMEITHQRVLMQAFRSLDDSERPLLMQYLMALEAADRPKFFEEYRSYDVDLEKMAYIIILIGAELVVHTDLDCFDHIKVDMDKLENRDDIVTWYNIQSLRGNPVLTMEFVSTDSATKKQREKGSLLNKDVFLKNIKYFEYPRDDGLYDVWQAGGLATRVLDLHPGTESDDLRCSIRPILSMESGEVPPYEALSYTWKETSYERSLDTRYNSSYDTALRNQMEILHRVFCDGGYLEIGTGLRDALVRLRHPTQKRTLWVDQLCIDQHNLGERAYHVNLMRYIYNRAQRVLVWAGEEDDNSSKAFQLFKTVTEGSQQASLPEGATETTAVELPDRASAEWHALYKFFERPVFTRGWVVQEIALGQQVTVKCGDTELGFDPLADVAAMLSHPSWQLVGNNPRGRNTAVQACLIGVLRNKVQHCESMTLHQILFETSKFGITDEKDRIYAFLGLLQRQEDGEVRIHDYGIQPDYKKPARDIFMEATKAVILHDKTLDICGRTGNAGSDTKSAAKNLPSWVPDFGEDKSLVYFSDPGVCSTFQASRSMPPAVAWPFDERQDVMESSARIVDTITSVATQQHSDPSKIPASLLEWTKMASSIGQVYPGGDSTMNAFSQTCTAIRTAIAPDLNSDDLFVGFISYFAATVMMHEDGEEEGGDDENRNGNDLALRITETCLQTYRNNPDLADPANTKIEDFITAAQHAVVSTTPYRKFFVTKKGYMGLGPLWMRPEDEIVILRGARVPFLIRRAPNPVPLNLGDAVYRMMGDCCVHGLMEGEACEDENTSWPKIFIY